MILPIHFTIGEIRDFFEANGFTVTEKEFGKFESRYHNREEWVPYSAAAVVIGDQHVEAEKLFKRVATFMLKSLVTPSHEKMKPVIETLFKHQLNSI